VAAPLPELLELLLLEELELEPDEDEELEPDDALDDDELVVSVKNGDHLISSEVLSELACTKFLILFTLSA